MSDVDQAREEEVVNAPNGARSSTSTSTTPRTSAKGGSGAAVTATRSPRLLVRGHRERGHREHVDLWRHAEDLLQEAPSG